MGKPMELERTFRFMREGGIDAALLCRYDTVMYASGFDTPLAYGCHDDMCEGTRQSYVVLDARSEEAKLLVFSAYPAIAREQCWIDDIIPITVFDHFNPIDSGKATCDAIRGAIKGMLTPGTTLGIEGRILPSMLLEMVREEQSSLKIVDIKSVMDKAKMIKSPREIELLRKAAAVEDAGHEALYEISKNFNGETEHEAWYKVLAAMTKEAGGLPVITSGELVTGERTRALNYPNGPFDRVIEAGDVGFMDISTKVGGYWCDCTNTVVFGKEPNEEQRYYFEMVKSAYDAAFAAMRPGVKCSEVNDAANEAFKKYDREVIVYTGHAIGTTGNEYPKIVRYDDTVMEENMVFCIEPQQYTGDAGKTGVRLERAILITKDGAEELNKFRWGITL